jgi:diguanylate cyclase (GGDEF)-like protein
MQYILSVLLLLIAGFLVILLLHVLSCRSLSQISYPFAGLMLAITIYAAGYAGELLSPTLSRMLFWNTFQYLGISFIPYLWITVTALYVNAPFFRLRLVQILLFVFSLITLSGALTDPWLHLKYASVFICMGQTFPVLGFIRGPLYYFHVIYTTCSFIISLALLANFIFLTCSSFHRTMILLIAGSALPFIDFMLYLSGIRIPGIDTIPFSMFFSALCSGLAVFSEKFPASVPAARSFVFEMISDAVIVTDGNNRITDYNKAACALFPGITKGANPVPGLLGTGSFAADTEFQTDISFSIKMRRYSCHVSRMRPVPKQHDAGGRILLFKDVTESARILEKMQEFASVDSLTGLYNRRYFMDRARQIIPELERSGSFLSFIIADIDLFKQINDTQGHPAGDAAIQAVAAVFSEIVCPPNIAARFGGEEFICLLPDTDAGAAFSIAEKIRTGIEKIPAPGSSRSSETSFYITASFGVASTDKIGGEQAITLLVSRADKALYNSKNNGRNRTTTG